MSTKSIIIKDGVLAKFTKTMVAALGLLIVAVGDNVLGERIWPQRQFTGVVLVDGGPSTPPGWLPTRWASSVISALDGAELPIITDWRGQPTKVLWVQRGHQRHCRLGNGT